MRERLREIIFGTQTRAGWLFDVGLILAILASLVVVSLESVEPIRDEHGALLRSLEWLFTGLFTVEYALRLWCSKSRLRYARSFFGIVDLLAVLPTYAALVIEGSHSLIVIRALRILRIFRVLKLAQFLGEANLLLRALRASRFKITVFLGGVLCVVVIVGAVMHLVEGTEHGFTSIPRSMYWAIVTMTTVGYGDITPQTALGQAIASMLMVLGYGIIAVPTGIVTASLVREEQGDQRTCGACGFVEPDKDARHCRSCGATLAPRHAEPEPEAEP